MLSTALLAHILTVESDSDQQDRFAENRTGESLGNISPPSCVTADMNVDRRVLIGQFSIDMKERSKGAESYFT